MKTVFTKGEGIKMNSSIDFGNVSSIINEFEYLMDTTETMWVIDIKYFYRITDDNYIQIAYEMDGGELQFSAQFKLRYENLKENLIFIIKEHIEAHLPYEGFPTFVNSVVFTKKEFNDIIKTMKDEKLFIIGQAKSKKTPIIDYLRAQDLFPRPTGNNPNSWVAKCPSGGNHHIMIVTKEDEWGCGYCKQKGKLPELKTWLQEIKIKKDQKNLSRMLKELKEYGSIQTEETLKWWMNRY